MANPTKIGFFGAYPTGVITPTPTVVQVGDVIHDPDQLEPGMEVMGAPHWVLPGPHILSAKRSNGANHWWVCSNNVGLFFPTIQRDGVIILKLPAPAAAPVTIPVTAPVVVPLTITPSATHEPTAKPPDCAACRALPGEKRCWRHR